MMDMLVKLYGLDDGTAVVARLREAGVTVRRALAPERRPMLAWLERHFGAGWAGECEAAFGRPPVSCLIGHRGQEILGFAAWDVTALGFFGPIGVAAAARGQGIGRALLHAGLRQMAAAGYGYAIIGAVGAPEFFAREVAAAAIPDSWPGIYAGLIKAVPPRSTGSASDGSGGAEGTAALRPRPAG